jgi:hypothetical protein
MDLHEKIRILPSQPGVYLYKNAEGEIIYVGKAKNLRSRVRSYLLEASQANAKTGSLMREAVDIDYILVANEHEALALENNLIKQRKPRFNILLRDDKTYPYVKLTLNERFPKVLVTRRLRKDGGAYYGPYFPGNLVALSPPRLPRILHSPLPGAVRRRTDDARDLQASRARRATLSRRTAGGTGAGADSAHDGRCGSGAV